MADHDGVRIAARLNVVAQFQSLVQVLSRLPRLLTGIRNDGHLDRSEAFFVAVDVLLQSQYQLIDDKRRHHHSGDDLLRLLHPEQEIHNELVLTLKNNRTGREYASCDMRRYESTDVRMANLLALRPLFGIVFRWRCIGHSIGQPGSVEVMDAGSCKVPGADR